jgi:hypothetical protein
MKQTSALLLALALGGCASQAYREAYKPQATPTDVRELSASEKSALKVSLAKTMKDPDAAQFRWMPLHYNPDSTLADYCAMVNGKNSYGGYTGWRMFRAMLQRNAKGEYLDGGIIAIEQAGDFAQEMVNGENREFCVKVGYVDFAQAR